MLLSAKTEKRVIPGILCLALAMVSPFQAASLSPRELPLLLSQSTAVPAPDPERELRTGATLTREGRLEEAIPHLIAARGRVVDEYAAGFNLALCYLGIRNYSQAIVVLKDLRIQGHNTAAMNNLLAQAYVGVAQPEQAFAALKQAVDLTPENEKLYVFVADACTDNKEYELGLRAVALGLQHLPSSARLHYERAMFLAQLDRFEEAKPEFERAVSLAPESDVAYLARVQEALFEDNLAEAIRAAREGINKGHQDYVLETLTAQVLIHTGAMPGQAEFTEARSLLESSVTQKPDYSTAQIALGKLYLMENRPRDAVTHLEIGRRFEPRNPAIYSNLATAYRRLGEEQKARQMLNQLKELLQKSKGPGTSPPK